MTNPIEEIITQLKAQGVEQPTAIDVFSTALEFKETEWLLAKPDMNEPIFGQNIQSIIDFISHHDQARGAEIQQLPLIQKQLAVYRHELAKRFKPFIVASNATSQEPQAIIEHQLNNALAMLLDHYLTLARKVKQPTPEQIEATFLSCIDAKAMQKSFDKTSRHNEQSALIVKTAIETFRSNYGPHWFSERFQPIATAIQDFFQKSFERGELLQRLSQEGPTDTLLQHFLHHQLTLARNLFGMGFERKNDDFMAFHIISQLTQQACALIQNQFITEQNYRQQRSTGHLLDYLLMTTVYDDQLLALPFCLALDDPRLKPQLLASKELPESKSRAQALEDFNPEQLTGLAVEFKSHSAHAALWIAMITFSAKANALQKCEAYHWLAKFYQKQKNDYMAACCFLNAAIFLKQNIDIKEDSRNKIHAGVLCLVQKCIAETMESQRKQQLLNDLLNRVRLIATDAWEGAEFPNNYTFLQNDLLTALSKPTISIKQYRAFRHYQQPEQLEIVNIRAAYLMVNYAIDLISAAHGTTELNHHAIKVSLNYLEQAEALLNKQLAKAKTASIVLASAKAFCLYGLQLFEISKQPTGADYITTNLNIFRKALHALAEAADLKVASTEIAEIFNQIDQACRTFEALIEPKEDLIAQSRDYQKVLALLKPAEATTAPDGVAQHVQHAQQEFEKIRAKIEDSAGKAIDALTHHTSAAADSADTPPESPRTSRQSSASSTLFQPPVAPPAQPDQSQQATATVSEDTSLLHLTEKPRFGCFSCCFSR